MATNFLRPQRRFNECRTWKLQAWLRVAAASILVSVVSLCGYAQKAAPAKSVVVQPGAPGKPTKVLPKTTKAKLPPIAAADVQFMQGMIVHHAQAVEMTALIESHTENKDVRSLGARISHSQADEIRFMKRWLIARGQPVEGASHDMHKHHANMSHGMMPGMLNAEQMEALKKAKGDEFDRLFLIGMIQHHGGALTMVKELHDTAGAGQDAELFNFATDVDSGQRAEIRVMEKMLEGKSSKEKQ
ncbi:MAG: DUF305 domain-containing protein [Acidobacteriota bacterium]|nr:DUF305 domain-containing protein [Acidobacteriota bacterium]